MLVKAKLAAIRETGAREYSIRFLLGGLATAVAGLISKAFGPTWGGLFLAFPAIFPASVTIIESHQKRRKEILGMKGNARARLAVLADAKGAELGCLGLAAFAATAWVLLPRVSPAAAIGAATLSWIAVSIAAWWISRRVS